MKLFVTYGLKIWEIVKVVMKTLDGLGLLVCIRIIMYRICIRKVSRDINFTGDSGPGLLQFWLYICALCVLRF